MTLRSKRFYADVFFITLAILVGTAVMGLFSSSIYLRNSKLEFQKAPFLQAANANAAAIVALDSRGMVSVWNEGATRLFGWTEAEMLGNDISRLADSHAGVAHADAFRLGMSGTSPKAKEVTCVARKKDGASFDIQMMVMTVPPQGAVAIIVDESKITRTTIASQHGVAPHAQ